MQRRSACWVGEGGGGVRRVRRGARSDARGARSDARETQTHGVGEALRLCPNRVVQARAVLRRGEQVHDVRAVARDGRAVKGGRERQRRGGAGGRGRGGRREQRARLNRHAKVPRVARLGQLGVKELVRAVERGREPEVGALHDERRGQRRPPRGERRRRHGRRKDDAKRARAEHARDREVARAVARGRARREDGGHAGVAVRGCPRVKW